MLPLESVELCLFFVHSSSGSHLRMDFLVKFSSINGV